MVVQFQDQHLLDSLLLKVNRMMSRQELTAVGDGPGAIVLLSPQAEQVGNKRGIQDHKTSFLCQKMQELPPRRVQHHILPAKATKMGTCGGGASLGPTHLRGNLAHHVHGSLLISYSYVVLSVIR